MSWNVLTCHEMWPHSLDDVTGNHGDGLHWWGRPGWGERRDNSCVDLVTRTSVQCKYCIITDWDPSIRSPQPVSSLEDSPSHSASPVLNQTSVSHQIHQRAAKTGFWRYFSWGDPVSPCPPSSPREIHFVYINVGRPVTKGSTDFQICSGRPSQGPGLSFDAHQF